MGLGYCKDEPDDRVDAGTWYRGSEPEPDSVECEGDMMYDEYKRIKAIVDKAAELLKCKPDEVIIRIIELKCTVKTQKEEIERLKELLG